MIAHIVLFKPRPELSAEAGERLADAFATAVRQIPSIRRARVGRRITHGRSYEALMPVDYQFAAVLEFDDEAGLKAYLEHPAHQQLGALFFEAFEQALMYDFALADGTAALTGITPSSPWPSDPS
jgi:hypothetical protein